MDVSGTIKKTERWRTDAFKLLCWRRFLKSPWEYKEFKPVNCKQNQSWIFIARTDAEAETLVLWPPDAKNWLTGKEPDSGNDWRWEEKETTEDAMIGWHHRFNGHEFEQTLGFCNRQGSLACCSPWGHKELDKTEWLNWTEIFFEYTGVLNVFIGFWRTWMTWTALKSIESSCVH